MPRTDRQIAEFMAYYSAAPKEEREWALKYLADRESKSPAEIRSIYEKYKESVNLRSGGSKAPDELIKRLKEEVASGISYKDVAKKYGVSLSLVQTATKRTIDEPKMDKDEVEFEKYVDELEEKRAADKPTTPKTSADFEIEPEGVYRQNFFENPPPEEREPIVEENVKTYLPHEKSVAGECKKLSWFEMIDALQAAAQIIFGKSVNITEMHASGYDKRAGITVETGGKRFDIVVEEV